MPARRFSNFRVGAAVRAKSGRIYTGCNIENATLGLTICAERVAIFKAMSEGERGLRRDRGGHGRGPADAAVRSVPADHLGILRRHSGAAGESRGKSRKGNIGWSCCRGNLILRFCKSPQVKGSRCR